MNYKNSNILCKNCGTEHTPARTSVGIYCSNKCQLEFQYKAYIELWLNGDVDGWTGKTKQLSQHIRKYLREERGTSCEECGWDERHPIDDALLTEIDHIDGNAENCRPENLKILCPNCHSMTPTFRARNKNSKRNRK